MCPSVCLSHIGVKIKKHFIILLGPMVYLTSGWRPSALPQTHMSWRNSAFSYLIYCSSSWFIFLFSDIWGVGEVTNTNADSRLCHLVYSPLSQPVCHSLSQPVCHSLSQPVCHSLSHPVCHSIALCHCSLSTVHYTLCMRCHGTKCPLLTAVSFFFFLPGYFSPRRGYRRVPKVCMGF